METLMDAILSGQNLIDRFPLSFGNDQIVVIQNFNKLKIVFGKFKMVDMEDVE